LAIARLVEGQVETRVHPALVHQGSMLASVDGSFNAVQIEGDLIGTALFYGRGAGSEPTSSAVIADLIALGTSVGRGSLQARGQQPSVALRPMHRLETRYFLRLLTLDRPGVMASIATVLGDRGISLASVVQKESVVLGDDVPGAEIVLTTHTANEAAVQEAITILAQMPVVRTIGALYRVFE
jgi:homoserine dehydrogenase